jgi:hypothetical protein
MIVIWRTPLFGALTREYSTLIQNLFTLLFIIFAGAAFRSNHFLCPEVGKPISSLVEIYQCVSLGQWQVDVFLSILVSHEMLASYKILATADIEWSNPIRTSIP